MTCERRADRRVSREDARGLFGGEIEDVADRETEVSHVERRGLEALAVARRARRGHVGQEAHLVGDDALPFARRAAAALRRVEREARRREAAHLRVGRRGEERADLVPDAEERRRHRARRAADRRLIDGDARARSTSGT